MPPSGSPATGRARPPKGVHATAAGAGAGNAQSPAPAIALWLLVAGVLPAAAASMDYCRPYASRVAEATIRMTWLRAYTSCLNSEGDPAVPTGWAEVLRLIDPPADPPVSDPPPPVVKNPPAVRRANTNVNTGGPPQALCTSHGMKTVYSGAHRWRCRK